MPTIFGGSKLGLIVKSRMREGQGVRKTEGERRMPRWRAVWCSVRVLVLTYEVALRLLLRQINHFGI